MIFGSFEVPRCQAKSKRSGLQCQKAAMIKATIIDPEKMEKIMSERIPEIAPKLALEHEMYTLTNMEN